LKQIENVMISFSDLFAIVGLSFPATQASGSGDGPGQRTICRISIIPYAIF